MYVHIYILRFHNSLHAVGSAIAVFTTTPRSLYAQCSITEGGRVPACPFNVHRSFLIRYLRRKTIACTTYIYIRTTDHLHFLWRITLVNEVHEIRDVTPDTRRDRQVVIQNVSADTCLGCVLKGPDDPKQKIRIADRRPSIARIWPILEQKNQSLGSVLSDRG